MLQGCWDYIQKNGSEIMEKKIREILPENSREFFDSIVEQRVLGASKHISMIGDMFEGIVKRGVEEKYNTTRVVDEIFQVADYFIETRGEASQAVGNAILMMIHGIREYCDMDIEEAAKKIIEVKNSYAEQAKVAVDKCVQYGAKLAEIMENILVYDYSSTVEKLLIAIASNKKKYTIYIPESRIIDGGRPFVKACQKAGHKIKFIPDASMMYYLKECDAVFMGAETFYPDGTGFNTTGSDIVGLICHYFGIPLYFITPMIKLDIRPTYGGRKNLVYQNLKAKLSKNWEKELDRGSVDFITPELVGVDPKFIRAFITEQGVIPANQMYNVCIEYSKNLRGE